MEFKLNNTDKLYFAEQIMSHNQGKLADNKNYADNLLKEAL